MYCDVEPKRIALAKANADLSAAQDRLASIKAKIAVSIIEIVSQDGATKVV